MKQAALLAIFLSGLFQSVTCSADEWKVVESDSYIGFIATYDDIPFEARFKSFAADIEFSPDALDAAVFDVRIDAGSVDSNSPDRDDGMKGTEWFAASDYPEARFRAQRFEKISGNRYRAKGELTLKDVNRSISVPFSWEQQSDKEAVLVAETRLKRGDFHIGTGEWAEDDIIGFDVVVKAHLNLTRAQ